MSDKPCQEHKSITDKLQELEVKMAENSTELKTEFKNLSENLPGQIKLATLEALAEDRERARNQKQPEKSAAAAPEMWKIVASIILALVAIIQALVISNPHSTAAIADTIVKTIPK